MNINDRLAALAAAPKPWEYVITYDNGDVIALGAICEAAAENGAFRYRRNIGRPLIRRETGETVVITSVVVRRRECVA